MDFTRELPSIPRRVPAHGRLPRDLINRMMNNIEFRGNTLWYKCSICHRTVRMTEMETHNKTYHFKVECKICHIPIDNTKLRSHQDHCPSRVAYCKYCSAETTLGELENHYTSCSSALRTLEPSRDQLVIPTNIHPNIPAFNALVQLSSEYSLSEEDEDLDRPCRLIDECENKFGIGVYQIHHKYSTVFSNLAKDKEQVEEDKRRLAKFLAKNGTPPKVSYAERHRDVRLEDDIDDQIDMVMANPYHPSNRPGTPYAHLASIDLSTVKDQLEVMEQRGQYTRAQHKLEGQFNRFETRQKDRKKKDENMTRRCERFLGVLSVEKVDQAKDLVRNQAIALEQQKSKLLEIPDEEWPHFIDELKGTRPIWPDFGLDPRDCSLNTNISVSNDEIIRNNLETLSRSNYKKPFDKETWSMSDDEEDTDEDDEQEDEMALIYTSGQTAARKPRPSRHR